MVLADLREEQRRYHLPAPCFASAPTALLEGMAEFRELEVHVITCVRQRLPVPDRLASNIFFHSCVVPWWGWLKTFYLPCIAAVRKTVRNISPSVVHGQGTERYCALTAVFAGLPSVLTVHGNMRAVARAIQARPYSFHGITAWLEAKTIPRAAGVLCLNEYTRGEVKDIATRTWKVPNAVGREFFEVKRRPDELFRLFCPALICNYKNQNALILALDRLAAEHSFTLSFAGAAPDTPYTKEFFQLISTRPWCEYTGVLGGATLKEAYARASMVVLPSLEDNCPMAILEAMAMGIPIAGARIGGIPDLIESGVNGVLFDPTCMSDMASAIGNCLKQPRMLTQMGIAARIRADKFHRPRVVADQHIAVYKECSNAGKR